MRRIAPVLLLSLCLCCKLPPIHPPSPPRCPATCPEATHCVDPRNGCEPIPAPGPVCETGIEHCDCYVWPDPNGWQLLSCPTGQFCNSAKQCEMVPVPECPPTCPPGTACDPAHMAQGCQPIPPSCPESCPAGQACTNPAEGCQPTPQCSIPPDEGWKPITPDPGQTKLMKIIAGQEQIGDRCGRDSKASGLLLVAKLNGWGECSTLFGADMLMIRAGDHFEEWDVVRGDGCWIQRYSGAWVPPGSSPPEPPALCPSPTPIRTDDSGNPRLKLVCHVYSTSGDKQTIDCTTTTIQQCQFCKDIGMGQINGTIRCGCPMRPDGDPDRVPCETWAGNLGYRVEGRNGSSCGQSGNQLQFLTDGTGNCRLCASDGTFCGEWF